MPTDTRCLGGQKQVMDLMTNHYTALNHIKSTLNTRLPPKPHIKTQMKKRGKTANNDIATGKGYDEQRETFRRITSLKGNTGDYHNREYKLY